jgi:hypothetical protein
MNLVRIRKCLETNKIWFDTIAAALISIMAIIVAVAQLSVMEKQSLIAERQYQSGINPVISIEMEDLGVGENGVYKLKIINNGVLDICNVEIYEIYLTCPYEQKGEHLAVDSKIFSISSISTLPIKKVPLVKSGDEIPYTIDIKKYIANTTEGKQYPCFLRLRIDYYKKVDGKPYRKLSAFGISNILFDLESEASKVVLANQPHINRVRDLLLNNF